MDSLSLEKYTYDPTNPTVVEVLEFFSKRFPNEAECKYVLSLLGFCLFGRNHTESIYFMIGLDFNEKTLLMCLLRNILAEFGDLTNHKRLVLYDKEKINIRELKYLSVCKNCCVFILRDELPRFEDNSVYKRIKTIPFRSRFYEESMHGKIIAWKEPFLSILLHYYKTIYLVEGLQIPSTIYEDILKNMHDSFADFLKVIECEDASNCKKELWNQYKEWCLVSGISKRLKYSDFMCRLVSVFGN